MASVVVSIHVRYLDVGFKYCCALCHGLLFFIVAVTSLPKAAAL
jgi:hypothetical protein